MFDRPIEDDVVVIENREEITDGTDASIVSIDDATFVGSRYVIPDDPIALSKQFPSDSKVTMQVSQPDILSLLNRTEVSSRFYRDC